MKKMVSVLILTLLSLWIPCACAEISKDLDPMVSPEAQATVTSDSSTDTLAAEQASGTASVVGASQTEKKTKEMRKEKSKKSSKNKSGEKKKKKMSAKSSKSSKKHKKNSN